MKIPNPFGKRKKAFISQSENNSTAATSGGCKAKHLKHIQSTDEWALYEKGKEYNSTLDLYCKVAANERFYRGEQWEGVRSSGLPKPVFNIFKRIINFYSSSILSSSVAMKFSYASPFGEGLGVDPTEARYCETLLNRICEKQWERLRMDELMDDALRDAAISGDAVAYTYWDPGIKTDRGFPATSKPFWLTTPMCFWETPTARTFRNSPGF